MPKRLNDPLLVQAAIVANRLDITGFTVDAVHRTMVLHVQGSFEQFAGDPDRQLLSHPEKALDENASKDVMAAATRILVASVLRACSAPADQAAAIDAIIVSNPDLAWQAFYDALRDALYTKV